MFANIRAKQYRFKLNNVAFTVVLDNTFDAHTFSYEYDDISYFSDYHYHMSHELFFAFESPITLLTDNNISEYKNCILCIPPKFNHQSLRKNDYHILFSFSYDEEKSNDFSCFLKSLESSEAMLVMETDPYILSCLRELSNIIDSGAENEEIIIAVLKLIFHKMYTLNSGKSNPPERFASDSYITKIESIISSFQNDINLKTVADLLHLSTKQTSRIIMKTYGKPLSRLLSEKRLDVACYLLRYTDKTISEIVEYVNFPSESYFYLQFKMAYGCTPYKYKKMANQE